MRLYVHGGRGWSDHRMVERLSAEDLFTPSFLNDQVHQDLSELRRRDDLSQGTGPWTYVPAADIVETHLDRGRLMHTFDHPRLPLMKELCNRVLAAMGQQPILEAQTTDFLGQFSLPILPSVSRVLACGPPSPMEIRDADPISLVEMITRSAVEYRQILPGDLHDMLRQRPDVAAFLEAFEAQA